MFMRLFPMFPTKKNNLARTQMETGPAEGDLAKVQVFRWLGARCTDQGEPGVPKNSSTAITWDGAKGLGVISFSEGVRATVFARARDVIRQCYAGPEEFLSWHRASQKETKRAKRVFSLVCVWGSNHP